MAHKNTLLHDALNNRTKADLEVGMKPIVKDFVKKHQELCTSEGISDEHIGFAFTNSLSKQKLLYLLAIPFSNKTLFQAFRKFMPDDLRTIFDELVWMDVLSCIDLEKDFNIIIYNQKKELRHGGQSSYLSFSLKKEFNFFNSNSSSTYSWYNTSSQLDFTLYFGEKFRKVIRAYYKKPKEATLQPLRTIPKTEYICSTEEAILTELPRISIYAAQDQIRLTKSGKPQPSTLPKMQRELTIKEFYPTTKVKTLKNLRSHLLAALITRLRNPLNDKTIPDQLSKLFQVTFCRYFYGVHGILNYLSGTGFADKYKQDKTEDNWYRLFQTLPTNSWINIDNLESHIKYNSINIDPVSKYFASEKLYYKYIDPNGNKYQDKHYINNARYYSAITLPSIKGMCFLFAAYGLLDIAYDTPDVSTMGLTAQSPYDSLKYIRLNKLGAYVLKKTDTYKMPKSILQSSIALSEDSLTITVDETDKTATILLKPYAQRVSPNRYRSDASFFLKASKSKADIDRKIAAFKQSVKVKIPANWEQFFSELQQKADPLKTVYTVKVFEISADNKDLLRLIAKDPKLQKLCFKAEGFQIIVPNTHMASFKKRLGEFGYLLV